VLNLYRDVFYIPDPTLSFLGVSVNTSAFSFFEYQSISIARVYSSLARLPNEARRWEAYNRMIREKGEGKFSHFLGKEGERNYVKETVAWLNKDAEWSGADRVEGHDAEWLKASDNILASISSKYGLTEEVWKTIRAGKGDDLAGIISVGVEKLAVHGTLAREEVDRKERIAVARRVGIVGKQVV
jgi:hypothetical protein